MIQFQNFSMPQIAEAMNKIKKAAKTENIYTNCFQEIQDQKILASFQEKTLIFCVHDLDFYRLYYYSASLKELEEIKNFQLEKPIVVDCLTKEKTNPLHEILLQSDYKLLSVYKRIINTNIPRFQTARHIEFAQLQDLDSLYARLFLDFNKYLDHFPTKEQMKEYITSKQVLIKKKAGKITGYLVYQIHGIKCHFNYWYNAPEEMPIHAVNLLINLYGILGEKAVKFVYAWVDTKKEHVIQIHKKFGFQFDGLMDSIYIHLKTL